MLPRWLIGMHLFVWAIVFVAAFNHNTTDWLWAYIAVYIAIGLPTIYLLVKLRRNVRKPAALAYWENKLIVQTPYLGVKQTRHWNAVVILGWFVLAVALVQHFNTTIDREFVTILSPYSMSNLLKVQAQWEATFFGFMALVGFSMAEVGITGASRFLSRGLGIRSHKFASAMIMRIGMSVFLVGLMLLVQNRLYSGSSVTGHASVMTKQRPDYLQCLYYQHFERMKPPCFLPGS